MATAPVLDLEPAVTDIVVAVAQNPGIVLLDAQRFDAFYDKLKAKSPSAGDMASRRDREALRSYAADVRSEKAAIDKARLRLTKEWRDMTAQANAAGKVIEERLETLAAEVRRPLTEWEEAEKARVDSCRADIEAFKRAGVVSFDDTAAMVRERGADLWQQAIDADRFGDMAEEARAAKEASVAALKSALARLEREEADAAELARLRAENEAREAREREERDARERLEREAEEARQVEQRKAAAARAEEERVAKAAQEAENRARREAEQAAEAERLRVQREHDEALAVERRAREAAESAQRAEAARIERERQAAEQEAARVAAEEARRRRNRAHVASVMGEAKAAIMSCGASEEVAKAIVIAIKANTIPHVGITF